MPENNRKTKKAGSSIFLLNELSCPAVLIECGFLSNNEECELLSDNSYRERLSVSIANAVFEFISEER